MKGAKKTAVLAVVSGVLLLVMVATAVLFSSLLKKSVTIEAGDVTLSASDFLRKGPSLLNYRLLTDLDEIDTRRPGEYVVQFLVNGKTQHSLLNIVDTIPPTAIVKKELSIPVGKTVSSADLVSEIEDNTRTTVSFRYGGTVLDEDITNEPGDHKEEIVISDLGGNETTYSVTIHVCNVKDEVTIEAGKSLKAKKFLIDKDDEAELLTDVSEMIKTPGVYPVELKIGGNTVEVKLKVKDTTAPEITQAEEMRISAGSAIIYKKYVTVTDNASGECSLDVDTSKVNPYEEGEYPVTYTATDKSGNKAKETFTLEVYKIPEVSDEELTACTDKVFKELGIDKTAPVTRDTLHEVYRWLKKNVRYTGISDKSSESYAAYEGFTTLAGDCYTYCTMAHVLFTKMGLDDIIITRDSERFHAWNLVCFEGTWYHVDASPLSPGETFECFLVGDAELAAFSESYGAREPEHAGYYDFDKSLYPERAE